MRCGVTAFIYGLALAYAAFAPPANAAGQRPAGGGIGYFMAGTAPIGTAALNGRLAAAGYPRLSSDIISVGGGGHGRIGRFIIGGKGAGTLDNSASNSLYKVTLSGGHGEFYVGFVVFRRGELSVYPTVGIGGGGFDLHIAPVAGGAAFDSVLTDPRREARLDATVYIIDLAVNIDHLFVLGEDEEGVGGFVMGIQGGYLYSSSTSDWQMSGATAAGGPGISYKGPYVRIMLGGGGYGHPKQ